MSHDQPRLLSMAHVLRLPQIDLTTVLTDQNPQIDLRLEVYENSTRNFLKAVSNYKNRAILAISDRRTNQAAEKKKVIEKTQAFEAETNQCKLKEIDLVVDLEKEKEERKDAELSVAAFRRQLASLRDKCASIDTEIEQYRAIATNLRRGMCIILGIFLMSPIVCTEKNKERATLRTHASRVSPEIDSCEHLLSCVIEGIERDQLLVRFSQIDAWEPDREFSFVLDLSDSVYKGRPHNLLPPSPLELTPFLRVVITSSPPLPTMSILVDALNESGDVYGFVGQVRLAYHDFVAAAS